MNTTKNDLEVNEDSDAAPCSMRRRYSQVQGKPSHTDKRVGKEGKLNKSTQPMGLTNAACQGLRLIRQVLPPSGKTEEYVNRTRLYLTGSKAVVDMRLRGK